MSMFGIFKSKEEKELEKFMDQTMKMIYPGGADDVQRDCDRVGELINWKIQGDELRGFTTGCKTLVFISKTNDDDGFVTSNIRRSNNRITPAQARDVYVYLAGESMMRCNFMHMLQGQGQGKRPTVEMEQELARLRKVWSVGTLNDTISGGYGEFGLTSSNPIPVVCIKSIELYISRLRFNGGAVEAERMGSTQSDVTEGAIDIYSLSQNRRGVAKIFICPYHRRDSKMAPKGFTLAST